MNRYLSAAASFCANCTGLFPLEDLTICGEVDLCDDCMRSVDEARLIALQSNSRRIATKYARLRIVSRSMPR